LDNTIAFQSHLEATKQNDTHNSAGGFGSPPKVFWYPGQCALGRYLRFGKITEVAKKY